MSNLDSTGTQRRGWRRRDFIKQILGAGTLLVGWSVIGSAIAGAVPRRKVTHNLRFESDIDSSENSPSSQIPFLQWSFGEIRRGDCTMAPGATLYLYANGATRWICDLRSSDSGDEWDGRFEIKNQSDQVLAATPNYHFDISQENVTRHWDEFRGPNASLAAAYPHARGISFFCSC